MRKIYVVCLSVLLLALPAGRGWADEFQLLDGTTVSGEVILPPTADGLNLKKPDGTYQRVPWEKFTQASLQQLDKNPKIAPFVEGLIEPPEAEREQATAVDIKPVERLEHPTKGNLIGALFQSSLGVFSLLLIYAASIYAAYEISIMRAYPATLVCGICAILPVIGQIIFLCIPTKLTDQQQEAVAQAQAQAQVQAEAHQAPEFHTADEQVTEEPAAGGLHLAHSAEAPQAVNIPETLVFTRGKFTFNRRFFETKFAGFFGIVRRETEKDMLLIVKSARGEYEAHRISRITANEMYLDARKGAASQEVAVPFGEIQEVKLKHKDAPA